jgi:hypothetical protein
MMIISRGSFTRTAQAIQSSNSTAAYTGNTAELTDGAPSSRCGLTWPSGSQTTSVYVHLPFRMAPVPTNEVRIFALLGLTGVPVGTAVQLYGGASANPTTSLATGTTEYLPDGTVGVWIVFPIGSGSTYEYYAWRIYNNTGGAATIVASSTVLIGELYASPAWDWPINRLTINPVDPSPTNRSDGGSGNRVIRPLYRRIEVQITPQKWDVAVLNGLTSLQGLLYDLGSQQFSAIVPRTTLVGNRALLDDNTIQQTATLVTLTGHGPLSSDAGTDRWPLTLEFEQSL